jgi:hypothetical protein
MPNYIGMKGTSGLVKPSTVQSFGGKSLGAIDMYSRGIVKPEYLGAGMPAGGNSIFSKAAHRVQRLQRIDNLVNDGVANRLKLTLGDESGEYNTPYELAGKWLKPNANGEVFIVDHGKIKLRLEQKAYEVQQIDDLTEIALGGDDICAYMFGLKLEDWKDYCKADNIPPDMDKEMIDDTLAKLNCSIQYINSLGPSILQSQSIAKLRLICQHYWPSVNMDEITTLADMSRNMRDGHNNPSKLSGVVAEETKSEMVKTIRDNVAASAVTE